jgi:hypothetical protein
VRLMSSVEQADMLIAKCRVLVDLTPTDNLMIEELELSTDVDGNISGHNT